MRSASLSEHRKSGDNAVSRARTDNVIGALVGDGERLMRIPLDKVSPAKDNPRRTTGDVSELAASIEAHGILEPLVVTPDGNGGYTIVCGSRRYAGAREAGLDAVPAIVRDLDEKGRLEVMIIENLQREDIAPLEEADAYKRLLVLGYTQARIAERVGRTQSHVSKRLSLLELPKVARSHLDSGGITLEEALELTRLKGMPKRLTAALKAAERSSWVSIHDAVKNELADHRLAQKVGKARRELQASGVTLVEWPGRGGWWGRKERTLKNQKNYWRISGDVVPLTIKQHEKEPCHAATVDEDGDVFYLCTDPGRHASKGKGKKPEVDEKAQRERARTRAHNKEMREANDGRTEFMRAVLGKRIAKPDALEVVARTLLARAEADATKLALQLLGIETKKDAYGYTNYRNALSRYAAAGPDELAKAAVAVSLATGEYAFKRGFDPERRRQHFDWLEGRGYDTTKAERRELAGRAPR